MGSLAFIYTRHMDPDGHRWFVRPGHLGHEEMTNTRGMLQALFGPRAGEVAEQVVKVGEVFAPDERGYFAPTGAKREIWDWRTIRLLAKRDSLFGRYGTLRGRRVVMLWGDPPSWEAMLVAVLDHLGVGLADDVVVVVGDARQFWARDFIRDSIS